MSTTITAEIIAAFRLSQRAFTDDSIWSDAVVTDALNEAFPETGGKRWGSFDVDNAQNFKRRGVFYYAAHWLAVTYTDGGAADDTAITSSARLNVASKSVGDESVTFRVGQMQKTEDDWLSLTNYGVQFLRLRGRVNKGAMAI